jgi:hypothetical protein
VFTARYEINLYVNFWFIVFKGLRTTPTDCVIQENIYYTYMYEPCEVYYALSLSLKHIYYLHINQLVPRNERFSVANIAYLLKWNLINGT